MKLRQLARLITPPIFVKRIRYLRNQQPAREDGQQERYGLMGKYFSWEEAVDASTGYDSEIILEKTKAALLKVKKGEGVYERDSVLFDEIQYSWPLLAGLMWVAARYGGELNVLDFGGSLGSTYFQNRAFLTKLPDVRWNIIEQSHYVKTGKECFEDDKLRFYREIEDCLAETQPNVVLLSSVLQYLEHPYTVLDQLLKLSCGHIIIDRTPFWAGFADRLCVQIVSPDIYSASYPSWIFSKHVIRDHLPADWQCMVTFDNPDKLPGPIDFSYQGMILVRDEHLP